MTSGSLEAFVDTRARSMAAVTWPRTASKAVACSTTWPIASATSVAPPPSWPVAACSCTIPADNSCAPACAWEIAATSSSAPPVSWEVPSTSSLVPCVRKPACVLASPAARRASFGLPRSDGNCGALASPCVDIQVLTGLNGRNAATIHTNNTHNTRHFMVHNVTPATA